MYTPYSRLQSISHQLYIIVCAYKYLVGSHVEFCQNLHKRKRPPRCPHSQIDQHGMPFTRANFGASITICSSILMRRSLTNSRSGDLNGRHGLQQTYCRLVWMVYVNYRRRSIALGGNLRHSTCNPNSSPQRGRIRCFLRNQARSGPSFGIAVRRLRQVRHSTRCLSTETAKPMLGLGPRVDLR